MSLSSIIKLMDEHPLEWEFSKQDTSSYNDYFNIVSHSESGIQIKLKYTWRHDGAPTEVLLWHTGSPELGIFEHWRLRRAVHRLQRSRLNKKAANYLSKKTKKLIAQTSKHSSKCPFCFEQPYDWCWVCNKCSALVHKACTEEIDTCPSCSVAIKATQ